MPEDDHESKPQERKKNDTTVQVTLITVLGGVITALITAVIAPAVTEYLKKTPTVTSAISPSVIALPSPTSSPSISSTPSSVEETTIYLQISSDSQRDEAKALRTRLTNRGFSVSEIENKEATSRGSIVVRYFYREDLDVAKRAQEITLQGATYPVELESLLTYPDKEPRGIIEIWYPLVK
jgi:hypothetical protein